MSARTRRALLDAATRLFSERGYAQTTVLDITESAGVTKGSLYYHFGNKEDVLLQIHSEMAEVIIERCARVLEDHPEPLRALAGLIRVHAHMAVTHQEAILVILRERKVFSAERWQLIRRQRAEIEKTFTSVIEAGQRTGDFALSSEPRLVALAIYGMINWSSEWYRAQRDDPDDVAEIFVDLVLPGLVHGPLGNSVTGRA